MDGPLRIAIDASRTTVARLTGTEHYALALIRALVRRNATRDTPHKLHLYFRDAPPGDLFPAGDHVTQHVIPWPRAWTHLRFAAAIAAHRPHVTFVPAHTLPFAFPGRAVVTVHDLGYKLFPQAHTPGQRRYLDLTTRYSAARARVVLADSEATARDLGRFYGTPAAKIRVVYPGVDPPPVGDIDAVRVKYGLPTRYFLFLGTLQPRKNIARITAAYRDYRAGHDDPAGLVLAGGQGWLYDPAWTTGIEGVRMTGYIDEADKGALYAGALALVFPSLYEGFGFPVLEALHCGTAVIASRTSSLPELVPPAFDEAGLLVDPLDTGAITAAMRRLESDAGLRESLIRAGQQHAKQFTWEQAAQQSLAALEAAAR